MRPPHSFFVLFEDQLNALNWASGALFAIAPSDWRSWSDTKCLALSDRAVSLTWVWGWGGILPVWASRRKTRKKKKKGLNPQTWGAVWTLHTRTGVYTDIHPHPSERCTNKKNTLLCVTLAWPSVLYKTSQVGSPQKQREDFESRCCYSNAEL